MRGAAGASRRARRHNANTLCAAILNPAPLQNRFFETFSFLPPLTNDQIARQVDYVVNNGWTPCLEFSLAETAYTADTFTVRLSGVSAVSVLFAIAPCAPPPQWRALRPQPGRAIAA